MLVVFSYNMNFYATLNMGSVDAAWYQQFVEDTLSEARTNGEKVTHQTD